MQIQIKPIASGHIVGFHTAVDAVAREGECLVMTEAPAIASTRRWFEGNIEKGVPQYVAVETDGGGGLVGWCDIIPDAQPGFEHCGRLGVGVLMSHRRKGIGRRLVSKTVEAARVFGLTRVELEVFSFNQSAIHLYREFGFEHEGCRRRARAIRRGRSLEYDDVLIMGLLFNDQAQVR